MTPNPQIFIPVFLVAVGIFCWNAWRRLSLVKFGLPDDRFSDPWGRVSDMLTYAFAQRRVIATAYGWNHFVIFWSFLVLLVANTDFLLSGLAPGLSLSVLPDGIHGPLLVIFDFVSLIVLAAVAVAMVRRAIDPPYPEARNFEAFFILFLIGGLMVAYFGLHGAEISLGEREPGYLPISRYFAGPAESAAAIGMLCWWLHAIFLLVFLNFLPLTKHMHILTAIPACFIRERSRPLLPPREEFAVGNEYGADRVDRLTWKDLFDGFGCTECGRCQQACPASTTGKPLNPRRLIHDIKVNLLKNAASLRAGEKPAFPLIGEQEAHGTVSEDTIWSCTTCGACVQSCPVFLEQYPKLVKMRRYLVEEKAKFPEELLNLFENMEQRSNPWGIAPTDRTKWTSIMDVKPYEAGKTEYLFYVGCAGSFDSRQKSVTVAIATLLDAAGVSWGILGKDEKCCGDSVRRLGNEYLFDKMAREMADTFRTRGVTKVIVQCPHCLTTLKNDYRQYGIELEVIHHAQLLDLLLAQGKLPLKRTVDLGKIAFHDPCYLARHNGIYDEPRSAVARVTGEAPAELPRNRENSFCCGAGGGRMWMEEHLGSRINIDRVSEALALSPDTVCVACPYCLTMVEDGIKDRLATSTRVRDVAEVVAEGLRP